VNNPQTFVLSFNKGHVDEFCEEIFPGMSKEEIINKFEDRLSVVKALELAEYTPTIYYFQNEECERDVRDMYKPFIKNVKNGSIRNEKFTYILYYDAKRGHDPLPKDETIFNINSIVMKNTQNNSSR